MDRGVTARRRASTKFGPEQSRHALAEFPPPGPPAEARDVWLPRPTLPNRCSYDWPPEGQNPPVPYGHPSQVEIRLSLIRSFLSLPPST